MEIVAIAVIDNNRVLGDGEDQPLKIKADWAHFKRTTMGHCLVMGRRTFEAMGVLPGRTTIVVSRHAAELELPDGEDTAMAYSATNLELAFGMAESLGEETCFVVGGGEVYAEALAYCDRVLLTEVDTETDVANPVVFPELGADWSEASREEHESDGYRFAFVEYVRDAREASGFEAAQG